MNRYTSIAAILAGASLALAGCSAEPEPTVTVTESAPSYDETPAETPAEPAYEETPTTTDEDLYTEALELTWENMDETSQTQICDGWSIDKKLMIDSFMEGASGDSFSRDDVRSFFDGKC